MTQIENKMIQSIEEVDKREVLQLAVEMARILLKNGAEIFRVEETIAHVCNYYEIDCVDCFILSNGIFVTAEDGGKQIFAKVKHVPLSSTHLGIVTEINNLSREIESGKIMLHEASAQLKKIEKIPPKRSYFRVLASGLGGSCFCYLLGGNLWESVAAFLIATIAYLLVLFSEKNKLPRIMMNILGGLLITILALFIARIPLPVHVSSDKLIIGSIMPLIPGLAFVNAIRDIANSDFLSGTIRIIDSLLVFVYIAIGVGFGLSVYSQGLGGIL